VKISKNVAGRCQISRLKCTKFNNGWHSATDPSGELTALPQTLLAGFKGPTSKVLRGWKRERKEWRVDRCPSTFFLPIYAHDRLFSASFECLAAVLCQQFLARDAVVTVRHS